MIPELLIVGLASWRLGLFLTDDNGPFEIGQRLRQFLRVEQGAGRPINSGSGWFRLWSCMRCMTFWTATAMAALWELSPTAVLVIAIWGIATLVDELLAHHYQPL